MSDTESMFDFTTDLETAEKPPLFPEGEYVAVVTKAEPKMKAETGNRWLDIYYKISPEQYPADYPAELAPDGKTVKLMSPQLNNDKRGTWNAAELKRAHGLSLKGGITANEFIGARAKVRVKHDTFNGVTREKVTSVQVAD